MLKRIIGVTVLVLSSATISAEQTQTEKNAAEMGSVRLSAGADATPKEMTCIENGVQCSPEQARMRLDEGRAAAAGKPHTPADANGAKPGSDDPGVKRVQTITCMEDGVECSPEKAIRRLDEGRDAARREAQEPTGNVGASKPPVNP